MDIPDKPGRTRLPPLSPIPSALDSAVRLLLTRFPQLPELLDEQLDADQPYYAYERLASELCRRRDEPSFFTAGCNFIDELAASSDSDLIDILSVTLLEKLAEDPAVALQFKQGIGPAARDLLEGVERGFYGRKA